MTILIFSTHADLPLASAPAQVPEGRPAVAPPTMGDLLAYCTAEVCPTKALLTQYHQASVFRRIACDLGALPVVEVTPAVLRHWRDTLLQHLKPGTVRQYLDCLSGVLTVAVVDLAWLPTHPMEGRKVRKPPASPGRVRILSPEEQARLLASCRASRNRSLYPLVLLALSTGARRGELFGLRWLDVDLTRGYLRLAQTKNKVHRAVPIPSRALEVLQRWKAHGCSERDWVFPRTGKKAPFPGEHAWYAAVRRAGLKDFRFHDLRHTCASYLAMSGASLIEIAEVLGHKTLAMVRRYSHFTASHTHGVVERMSQQFLLPPQGQEGAPEAPL